jgi:hypothetical protein
MILKLEMIRKLDTEGKDQGISVQIAGL